MQSKMPLNRRVLFINNTIKISKFSVKNKSIDWPCEIIVIQTISDAVADSKASQIFGGSSYRIYRFRIYFSD